MYNPFKQTNKSAPKAEQAALTQLSPVRARRPRRRAGAAAFAVVGALALLPAAASAQMFPQNVSLNTGASLDGMVLDVSGASTAVGAPVIQWYQNGGANQRWNIVPDFNGYEHIVNVNSGMCLATNGQPGNHVSQWPCSNSTQEDWRDTGLNPNVPFSGGADPGEYIYNPETNMYLNINGASPFAGAQLIAWYYQESSSLQNELFNYTQH
jgi:hypothetical protein